MSRNPRRAAPDGLGITRSWEAKIVRNKLYLHGKLVYKASCPIGSGSQMLLRDFIHLSGHLKVCGHLSGSRVVPSAVSAPSCTQAGGHNGDSSWPTFVRSASCPICCMDYQIRIIFRNEGWEVKISRWHGLGDCRVPKRPETFVAQRVCVCISHLIAKSHLSILSRLPTNIGMKISRVPITQRIQIPTQITT